MSETYFVPNPDKLSPVGLLEVLVVGEESIHHNLAYAEIIRRAIEASNVDDPQARVMEAFYRGSGIPRELMGHVEPTVQEHDVAWPTQGRLYNLVEAGEETAPLTSQEIQELGSVLETPARLGIYCLTEDGLLADASSGGSTPLLQSATEPLIFDEEELRVVTRLGTEVYAYQTELVWRTSNDGVERPVLLSDRQHLALGHVAADGSFEHIATLLEHSHPARQLQD